MQLSKAEAQAYLKRWRRVNALQTAELRRMTPAQKLDEVARLMQWAQEFGWTEKLSAEDAAVRNTWARLRKAYQK